MPVIGFEARADWPFLRHGAVTLFRQKPLFQSAKASLAPLAYRMLEVKCSTRSQFAKDLGDALKWQELFGYTPWTGNLNALNDGLASVEFPASSSIALCFEDYHRLVEEDAAFAHAVLDLIEHQSRNHLVCQRRMVALIQTDAADYVADNLGARGAGWNDAEWLIANRL